ALVGTISEKAGCLNRRVQSHCLRAGKYAPRESQLHHRLTAGYLKDATELAERRRKVVQTPQHLIDRHVSAVLQMPGVRVVAVCTSKQAARYEQYDAQSWS